MLWERELRTFRVRRIRPADHVNGCHAVREVAGTFAAGNRRSKGTHPRPMIGAENGPTAAAS